jgi:hypothetical protein
MNEQDLRGMIEDVRREKLSRRAFTRRMIGLGLTAPLAAQMLASSGVAAAAENFVYKPTRRGGGGAEGAVVAGADPAQSAFRGRHQGPGCRAHFL